jgi:hypothetical protein
VGDGDSDSTVFSAAPDPATWTRKARSGEQHERLARDTRQFRAIRRLFDQAPVDAFDESARHGQVPDRSNE